MAYNALIDDATLSVLSYGFTIHVPGPGQTQVALNMRPRTRPVDDVLTGHHKIVAGAFVEMTTPEKAVVDAANAATDKEESSGAIHIDRSVATTADLATPPSRSGLMVIVDDVGGGIEGFAISTVTGWNLYRATQHFP